MIEKIKSIPDVPEALRISAKKGTLVPFIGAGVSQIGGCPGWDDFANMVLNELVRNEKVNHALVDQISPLASRLKLSVAIDLGKAHGVEFDFGKILKPSQDKRQKCENIYSSISKLGTTFVTTNYDDLFDNLIIKPASTDMIQSSSKSNIPVRKSFYKKEDISIDNLGQINAVFHIHGSIHDRDSMIITTADYLERYASHRIDGAENYENPFLTFLKDLFKQRNVVFVGYSLNELEVLEYILQKGVESTPPTMEEPRHYAVLGFFTHQIDLARALDVYYRRFGIGLIPFSRDENNWDQLIKVLEDFAREIKPMPPTAWTRRIDLEQLL